MLKSTQANQTDPRQGSDRSVQFLLSPFPLVLKGVIFDGMFLRDYAESGLEGINLRT